MTAGSRFLLLSTYLMRVTIDNEGLRAGSRGCYAVYNTLAQSADVMLYPAACAKAVDALCAHSPPKELPHIHEAQCSLCSKTFALQGEALVAPHNGIHWMHMRCYFLLLGGYTAADALPGCPCCGMDIAAPFTALVASLSLENKHGGALDNSCACPLFALPVDSPLAANSHALLKDALSVLRNIMWIRQTYGAQGDIFEVVVDLSGLGRPEAIIAHLNTATRNASILDIYLAELIPPSRDHRTSQALYAACLAKLNEAESESAENEFEVMGKNIARLVLTQLAAGGVHSRMPQIVDALQITKKSVAERLARTDCPKVVTAEATVTMTVVGNVWIKDSAGNKTRIASRTTSAVGKRTVASQTSVVNMAPPADLVDKVIAVARAAALPGAKRQRGKQAWRAEQDEAYVESNSEDSPSSSTQFGTEDETRGVFVSLSEVYYVAELM